MEKLEFRGVKYGFFDSFHTEDGRFLMFREIDERENFLVTSYGELSVLILKDVSGGDENYVRVNPGKEADRIIDLFLERHPDYVF